MSGRGSSGRDAARRGLDDRRINSPYSAADLPAPGSETMQMGDR